jgi:hypothetical protein
MLVSVLLAVVFPTTVGSQAAETEKTDEAAKAETKEKKKKIKPYDEVITKEAVTRAGLFRVHQVEDKLFYELLGDVLGVDLLWVTQIAETTAGSSYAGIPAGNRVVRWEKRGDRVLLREVRYDLRAETDDPIAVAVKKSNLARAEPAAIAERLDRATPRAKLPVVRAHLQDLQARIQLALDPRRAR